MCRFYCCYKTFNLRTLQQLHARFSQQVLSLLYIMHTVNTILNTQFNLLGGVQACELMDDLSL